MSYSCIMRLVMFHESLEVKGFTEWVPEEFIKEIVEKGIYGIVGINNIFYEPWGCNYQSDQKKKCYLLQRKLKMFLLTKLFNCDS